MTEFIQFFSHCYNKEHNLMFKFTPVEKFLKSISYKNFQELDTISGEIILVPIWFILLSHWLFYWSIDHNENSPVNSQKFNPSSSLLPRRLGIKMINFSKE